MNRDIGILTLASTLRDLIQEREQAHARVTEIDAVLDDCRSALSVPTPSLRSTNVAEDVAIAICKCGKVFVPSRGAAGQACSRACYEHQAACRRREAAPKAVVIGPVTAGPRCQCRPDCAAPLPKPNPNGGRRCIYAAGHSPTARASANRNPRIDEGVIRSKHLGKCADTRTGVETHDVVFSGRTFTDGRGLSSAMGNSSLAGTAPAIKDRARA